MSCADMPGCMSTTCRAVPVSLRPLRRLRQHRWDGLLNVVAIRSHSLVAIPLTLVINPSSTIPTTRFD